ncbi:MAG TPA: AIR synthase related protein, partial [Acidothermaceae bacterium]|nr:AIR synthase related protein [Acidothermaceae bacterium]
ATVIGEVTDTGRLEIFWRDELVVDVPPRTVAHEGPVYDRPIARPADLDALNADDANALPRPSSGEELRATLLRLVGSSNLADKSWITDQYDRYVLGGTALAMPDDAGVLRVDDATELGIALALDGNGRYTRLDPYAGAQLALAEAYRNVAAAGARPLAVTDCLNFGSPEDPEVMWQFTEAIRGIADGCLALGVPVTGGNVSFYNQTGSTPINPTPVVGVLGVIDDVARRRAIGFDLDGAVIYQLGETRAEFGGSEWAHVAHDHLGGRPPRVDLDAERALAKVLVTGATEELIAAAHDLSEGGLAQALVESCLRGGRGARISLPGGLDPFVALFSESSARAVVAVSPSNAAAFEKLAADHGVPLARIGVTGGDSLEVDGLFAVGVDELRATSSAVLSGLFD